ncbi:alpha/beta fold hydrolase [Candidatus Woesearchaeota archaeon]|nr:alpha/beta fold hydrolase [Candidatus Woesearchaeota archaeon]
MEIKEQKVFFQNDKNQKLAGILTIPQNSKSSAVILCHGFKADKNTGFLPELAKKIAGEGHTVLRFDFSGSGESEGNFENTTVTQQIKDLEAAVQFMKEKKKMKKIVIIGHSLGGMVTLLFSQNHPEIKAVVTIAPPFDYTKPRKALPELSQWKKYGFAYVQSSFSKKLLRINYDFYEDVLTHDIKRAVKNRKMPLLILQGTADTSVQMDETEALYKTASNPKKLIKIKNADHHFKDEKAKQSMFEEIVKFLAKKE